MNKDIVFLDLAVLLKSSRTLIITDLHIGYEESLANQGVFLPRFQLDEIIMRLTKIIQIADPLTIVLNGDIKHEFGTISSQEWTETIRLLDFLSEKNRHLVLIKGNHDAILDPIAKKRGIKIVDHFEQGTVMITHGDRLLQPERHIRTIIIGHEHPAISLHASARDERFKCFLTGRWEDRELIVIPSFNPVIEGSDILQEETLSPYLSDLSDFSVYIPDDKAGTVRFFGKVKDLISR